MACAAQGAQISEKTISLNPNPIPLIRFPPVSGGPAEVALTVGDLNNDGVPDLVVSNELAFLRVYFLARNPVTGDLSVAGHSDIFTYTGNCPDVDNRILTTVGYYATRPIIYDIDLDGTNDLVYLDFIPPDKAALQVYEWNGSSFARHVPAGSLLDLQDPGMQEEAYFGTCAAPKHVSRAYHLRIANVRGRAFPQDIVVWADLPYLLPYKVYAYDSTTSPRITSLFNHTKRNRQGVISDDGSPGHNVRSCDVDYDGKEELIGHHVVKYTGVGTPPYDILWGMVLRTNEDQPIVSSGGNSQLNIHPDNIRGLDFLRTYVDGDFATNGRVYPSPGIEILAAPQTGGYQSADPSGPLIYRALTGHMLDQGAGARRWPRKVIKLAKTSDGDRYWFPSKSNPTVWRQPVTGGANPSNWDQFGAALEGGINGDPNAQDVITGDFLYDPVGDVDTRPGLELLVQHKKGLVGVTHCNCSRPPHCLRTRTHAVFDPTNSLAAVAWGENGFIGGVYVVAGPEEDVHPVDLVGDRTSIEVLTPQGINCDGTTIKAHLFQFVKDNGIAPKTFRAVSLWSTDIWPGGFRRTGFAAADVFGDSREEVLYLYETLDAVITEAKVIYDAAESQRPEPTPFAFLDYRRRNQNQGYRDAFAYRPFSGLRFHTKRLLPAKASVAYGVQQDPALGAGGIPGCAVLAEGGTPPYTIDIVGGRLPLGLSKSWLLPGIQPYGGLLFLSGTPVECATRRLRMRVTDSLMPTPRVYEQDFWITVGHGDPPCIEDTAPRIVQAGYESVFFRIGQPSDLVWHAKAADADDSVVCVKLFDQWGNWWGDLLDDGNQANGDLIAGDGIFSKKFPGLIVPITGSFHFTMVAIDASGQQSLRWPYLIADGGAGNENPPFHPPADLGNQTAANTPVVTEVGFELASVVAAETSDAASVVPLTVLLDRKGMNVEQIKVRIGHPLTSFQYETVLNVPVGQQQQNQYVLTLNLPATEFGWGFYTLNVQACVRDPQTSTPYVSNWWPRLRVHP